MSIMKVLPRSDFRRPVGSKKNRFEGLTAYIAVYLGVRRRRAAAEVAQLPLVVYSEEHVLRLDVPVRDRWRLHVHVEEALHDVRGDHQHLALRKALASLICPLLDQVEQVAAYSRQMKEKRAQLRGSSPDRSSYEGW